LVSGITVGDRRYPISALAGTVPIVVAPHSVGLDEPREQFAVEGSGSRRKSALQLAQECLNASADHRWALVSNGRQIRLLRDAATLTRPSFLEIDLQDVLGGQRYTEFAMAWRLLHASRALDLPSPSGRGAGGEGESIWERWREAGNEEGTRVREGLSEGVSEALLSLGSGFLAHPANHALRQSLQEGGLDKDAYFQQLLRLVYRLIFLFSVEERGLLHSRDASAAGQRARQAYAEGYAMGRLRDHCLKRRARNRYDDLWQAARIVFKGLATGEPRLALPALGGVFAESQCPDLDQSDLDNTHWLRALAALRWSRRDGTLDPVDYRNMGFEEMGSVYESLLELVPELDLPARRFGFVGLTAEGPTAGNARKLTGSYYTPDALVQELIQSALDPVIEQRLAENPAQPIAALLDIKVIDPACGSGHFLLAAARRLGERLAQLRTSDGAVKPEDYRHALREVIAHCIHGVDKNPMAIELARTALWLEGFEEGRPLGFLDHRLQCGDALLGVMDLESLELGIPKDAFKALSGDDKGVCKALTKANAEGLKQLKHERDRRQMVLTLEGSDALAALSAIESMPEDRPEQIAAKEAAYRAHKERARDNRLRQAADLLVGAFLLPKVGDAEAIPTSQTLYLELRSDQHTESHRRTRGAARQACAEAQVFHWPLQFPQVFARGAFDCVLGNPPWEVSQMGEEEFFAARAPQIAALAGDKRKRAISSLETDDPRLWTVYVRESQQVAAGNAFFRASGRFERTAVGKLNTYSLFVDLMDQITAPTGRAGFIVPTGIATDDSTKAYFGHITSTERLISLYDFRTGPGLFSEIGHQRYKFCLLTLGAAEAVDFVFFATDVSHLDDARRHFTLTTEEFRLINPNTLTCPVFRSARDAELTKKLYRAAPVLIEDGKAGGNPWDIRFSQGLFNMTSDSNLFADTSGENRLPLYEAKMIHQFDHRWATYDNGDSRDVTLQEKVNPNFEVRPRYWVENAEVRQRLADKDWSRGWLMG
jgi:hypothetical protein